MTADMAFESVTVAHDAEVFKSVNRVLSQYSICTSVCFSAERALEHLKKGSTDLLVIDCEGEESSDLLHTLWTSIKWKKPTVLAIASGDLRVTGAHILLRKPFTAEMCSESVKAAYARMLVDFRMHARCALMMPVFVTDSEKRTLSVTIADIGPGGVGIFTRQALTAGTVLRFQLRLPDTVRDIHIEARILWVREFGRVGCEFVRIPPVDLTILRDWLKSKITVKKPMVEV